MSGGAFEYKQYTIQDVADQLEQIIMDHKSEKKRSYDDELKYDFKNRDTIKQIFRGMIFARLAAIYAHRIDYLISDDDGEEDFLKRLQEDITEIKDQLKTTHLEIILLDILVKASVDNQQKRDIIQQDPN